MKRNKAISTLRPDEQELLVCKCGDVSHQCIIGYTVDDSPKEVFLSVHLVREPNIFKRMAIAIKYIWGARSIYGDFDEIILSPKDAPKLQKAVDYLKSQQQ